MVCVHWPMCDGGEVWQSNVPQGGVYQDTLVADLDFW